MWVLPISTTSESKTEKFYYSKSCNTILLIVIINTHVLNMNTNRIPIKNVTVFYLFCLFLSSAGETSDSVVELLQSEYWTRKHGVPGIEHELNMKSMSNRTLNYLPSPKITVIKNKKII